MSSSFACIYSPSFELYVLRSPGASWKRISETAWVLAFTARKVMDRGLLATLRMSPSMRFRSLRFLMWNATGSASAGSPSAALPASAVGAGVATVRPAATSAPPAGAAGAGTRDGVLPLAGALGDVTDADAGTGTG